MLPLISVIIPVYNMAERLKYMVESLKKQDYGNLEVIFCDDASTDGIMQYLEDLRCNNYFSRTIVLHNNVNKGVSFSRNRSVKSARGEFVNFLDADDLVEPNFFSSLYNALSVNKSDYAACGHKRLNLEDGKIEYHYLRVPENADNEEILLGRIFNRYEISHWALLIGHDFLLKNKLFYTENCSAGEDMEFLIKLLCANGHGTFIEDCLYTYVQHEQMGSRKNTRVKSKRIQRYFEHTEAQFREIEYIKAHYHSKN
jgi:glycosyltransferase involved in cell wall biosynthesis